MGGSKTASSSKSDSKTPEQRAGVATALDTYLPTIGQNENVFQGNRVAPLTGLQETAIGGAENISGAFTSPQNANVPLFGDTGKATQDLLQGNLGGQKLGQDDVQDYFQNTIYNPTMTAFKEDAIPGINEAFAGPGFFGSARSQGIADAQGDVQDQLGQQWAKLNWDVLQNNQQLDEASANRTLSTLPSAMAFGGVPAQNIKDNLQIAAGQIEGLGDLIGIGGVEQTQEQAELESTIIKFAEENQITDPDNLAVILSLLGMNFSKSSSSSSGFSFNTA